ncbi:MAG: hypothetical protein OXG11_08375 [Chloroflexi bacterium]|nr:hypothetical protein [Chloroflexota bacterium]
MNDQELENEFHQAMFDIYGQAAKLGYHATRFLQSVEERGGVMAARHWLRSSTAQSGLDRLWDLGRLDISMEATVLSPRFRSLFSSGELKEARKRLKDRHWDPPEYP